MIPIKSIREIEIMREACRITAEAMMEAGRAVRVGISTRELDGIIRGYIEKSGAVPSFLGLYDFPASACISVNEQVIHGIPGKYRLKEGDIVKIDTGAFYKGFHGDCARTFPVGRISEEAERLIRVTRESFYKGVEKARQGCRVFDISHAVEEHSVKHGYMPVREYTGHGVGEKLHEPPQVPNFGTPGHGPRLLKGMTLAIEPMINAGGYEVRKLNDGWTIVTADGSLSAHYENTVLITGNGYEILTQTGTEEANA